ncbi:predicted protein [Chaetoceros tenuissimus]|uniref:Uncharacterized protein n=1 Tax=Chaetoceros tenuissimus TaxID=426638 RepID=A0AAD3H2D3_9STRA|nr:predicted protein [Chaetoceros tenuissimus]
MSTHSNHSGSLHENDSLTRQDTVPAVATITSSAATSSSPTNDTENDQQITTTTSLKEKLDRLENFEKSSFALSKTIETNKSSYREDTPENNDEINDSVSFYLSKFLLDLEASDLEDKEQKKRLKKWIAKYPKSLGAIYWNYVAGPDYDGYDEDDYDNMAEVLREKHEKDEKKYPFQLREALYKKKFELIVFFVEIGQWWFGSLKGGLLKDLRKSGWDGLDSIRTLGFYLDKVPGPTALDVLIYGDLTEGDESIPIQILNALKDKELFRKCDIKKQKLLTKACLARNVEFDTCKIETGIAKKRLEYLVKMYPQGLLNDTTKGNYDICAKEIHDRCIMFVDHDRQNDEYVANHHTKEYVADGRLDWRQSKVWTPPLMIFLATRALVYFEIALATALKVFGKELGLLLLQDNSKEPLVNNAVLLTHVKRRYGIDRAWNVVQTAFEAMPNCNVLLQFDKEKNAFPFMLAAESLAFSHDDGDIKLTLLYYLLREDLSWSDVFSQQSV